MQTTLFVVCILLHCLSVILQSILLSLLQYAVYLICSMHFVALFLLYYAVYNIMSIVLCNLQYCLYSCMRPYITVSVVVYDLSSYLYGIFWASVFIVVCGPPYCIFRILRSTLLSL